MDEKGMTLVEVIVGILLVGIIIAGAASVQIITQKLMIERQITTNQRHILEIIKEDILSTLTFVTEEVVLSDATTSELPNTLGWEEGVGYVKGGRDVFGEVFYENPISARSNAVSLGFELGGNNSILCTIKIEEVGEGGIGVEETFPIRPLNSPSIEAIVGITYHYVHYTESE